MNKDSVIPFGRHRGKKLSDIPAHYFLWLYDQNSTTVDGREVCRYIRKNLKKLRARVEKDKNS